jgi:phospholipid/cholesterol/gamma-HCH transport system substrate-binding protein
VASAESGVAAVDNGLTKTQSFLKSLASDKSGGELLPTVISMRELIQSFDKKSGVLMADWRKMLGDLSASMTKADRKLGGR